jgi:hypothetical protein
MQAAFVRRQEVLSAHFVLKHRENFLTRLCRHDLSWGPSLSLNRSALSRFVQDDNDE